jgi:ABC-type sugar transport system permease subunit
MQPSVTRTRSDLERAQTRAGYLFILPSFALYIVFVLAPVIVTFVLSFTYYDPMAGSRWVGLENFQRFFTGDRSLQIFWNTLCFAKGGPELVLLQPVFHSSGPNNLRQNGSSGLSVRSAFPI